MGHATNPKASNSAASSLHRLNNTSTYTNAANFSRPPNFNSSTNFDQPHNFN